MKVLVLGGTGAMGIHLVRILVEQGYEVFVTSRHRSGTSNNLNFIQGNAHNMEFLKGLLNQVWDVIVDFMIYNTQEFQQRHALILDATKQYFYISSSRVYAKVDGPINESSSRLLDVIEDKDYLNTDEYALTKARQENLLFESNHRNWTIIRPYITYDNERLQLGVLEKEDWLYRALQGRSIIVARDIQHKNTTLTSGEDVAKSIFSLIGQEAALGEAFHITNDQSISWQQVLEIYQNVLSKRGFKNNIVEQELESFLVWRKNKYQVIYDRLFDRTFNNQKINHFIDTSTFISPQYGLEQCLESFLDNTPCSFKSIDWREEALKDRATRECTNFSEISGIKQKIKYQLFKSLPEVGRLLKR
ncbi:NAD(P)H-binding protein [Marinomonas shanghaiensis]|uniref:NAD(P)H-binding protein n=1 Tax=Marinomonas shanghaiensis TaxID=2202418 RepID=UPI000DBA1B2A|nr:NAD(P)H-binding protein [Marinomonas shanghaiensis]